MNFWQTHNIVTAQRALRDADLAILAHDDNDAVVRIAAATVHVEQSLTYAPTTRDLAHLRETIAHAHNARELLRYAAYNAAHNQIVDASCHLAKLG